MQNVTETKLSTSAFLDFFDQKHVPLEKLKDFNGEPLEKILKYWRMHGLVPFLEKGKWIRISFAQLIWLRILDTLRQLGYSLKNTKAVCEYLFQDAYDADLPEKNIKASIDELLAKQKKGNISDYEEDQLNARQDILENHRTILDLMKTRVNYLTNLVKLCVGNRQDGGIMIFMDGTIAEVVGNFSYSHRAMEIDPAKPHIFLPILFYLKEFIEDDEFSPLVLPQLLDDGELYVINQMREGNLKELRIEFTDGEIRKIDSIEAGIITGSQMNEIKSILGLKNYESIQLTTRDEKTLSFKKTKMKI